jgi:hypothetical protein
LSDALGAAAAAGRLAADFLGLVRLGAARLLLRAGGAAFFVDLRADPALLRVAVLRRVAAFAAVFLRGGAARFAVFFADFFFFADFDFRAVAITSSCLH